MKKSMAKVLASALSLAMAVTLVTPTDAAAASAPKFVKTYGKLYSNAVYSVKNVKKGYKVKVSVSGTAKSAVTPTKKGAKVSTIKATGSTVKFTAAVKASEATAGKGATVKVVVYNTKGKKVKTLSDGIRVMAHATGISVTAPETVGLNTDTQLATSVTPSYATDEVTYTVDPADGATVSSTGVFNATKVGEYKVTASVNGITSEAVTVKAQAMMKSVKLTKPNTVEIAFDTDMSAAKPAVDKDNVKIANKDASVTQPVKKVTLSKDGMTATVETFANFENDKNYEVTYNGQTLSLAAKIGEPASVVVTGKSIKFNTEADIDFKVLDANGVELTDKKGNVTFEAKDANGNDKGFVSGSKLVLFEIGDTAQVTATYHTGKYENGTEITFKSEPATYTAVEKLDVTGTITAYTLSNKSQISKVDFTTPDKYLFAEGAAEKLVVKGKDADGNEINSLEDEGFVFETADDSVATVNGEWIKGVKEGTAHIKVSYGTSSTVVELTVAKEAKVNSIVPDKKSITLSKSVKEADGTTATADAIVVNVTLKDQFGQKMSDEVKVEKQSKEGLKTAPTFVDGKVTFTATKDDNKGDYEYKLTCGDRSDVVKVKVVETKDTTPTLYKVELDQSEVDTAVNADSTTAAAITVNASVVAYNKDNVKITKDDADEFGDVKLYKGNDDKSTGVVNTNAIDVRKLNTTTVEKLLDAGNYKVRVEVTDSDGNSVLDKVLGANNKTITCTSANLTVKDNQDGGKIVVKENSFASSKLVASSPSYANLLEYAAKHVKIYTKPEVEFTAGEITYVTINGKSALVSANDSLTLDEDKNQIYIGNVVVNEKFKISDANNDEDKTEVTVPVTYTINRTFTITK